MTAHINTLRPVGNPVLLKKSKLDYRYFATPHVEFYQSGTAALAAALIAAKETRTDTHTKPEVLLPAYACPDLISASLHAGLTPVLIDLTPDSCWMSLETIENAITERTVAMIAVRFLGIAEQMTALRTLCQRYDLTLIEDSAQGFPTGQAEKYWQGDLAILSFGRGKPVNMLGGGAVVILKPGLKEHLPTPGIIPTSIKASAAYASKVTLYNLLIRPFAYGMATRLPGLNVGETVFKPLNQIAGMPETISTRLNSNIDYYTRLPNIAPEIHSRLREWSPSELIDLPGLSHHDFNNPLLRYPLLVKSASHRDKLYRALSRYGASLMYQRPLYQISGIPSGSINRGLKLPVAGAFSQQLITIPTHTGVTEAILDQIFSIIREIVQ
ncbi:MAG: hypothetical protein GC149_17450 [Gammaproteobacteria bacterium]|nr:hypothetical protein [Gammaproteobacteria bacterium]